MKYLKTFAGLFAALYFPLMIVIAIVMKPRDPNVTSIQAALIVAGPVASLIVVIALGFALVTWVMDKQKPVQAKQTPAGASYKKKKKKKRV